LCVGSTYSGWIPHPLRCSLTNRLNILVVGDLELSTANRLVVPAAGVAEFFVGAK
jgi:hypothetical protein